MEAVQLSSLSLQINIYANIYNLTTYDNIYIYKYKHLKYKYIHRYKDIFICKCIFFKCKYKGTLHSRIMVNRCISEKWGKTPDYEFWKS